VALKATGTAWLVSIWLNLLPSANSLALSVLSIRNSNGLSYPLNHSLGMGWENASWQGVKALLEAVFVKCCECLQTVTELAAWSC